MPNGFQVPEEVLRAECDRDAEQSQARENRPGPARAECWPTFGLPRCYVGEAPALAGTASATAASVVSSRKVKLSCR